MRGERRTRPGASLTSPHRRYVSAAALSTARTRAGVIGTWRIRTPVASKNAFAIAAGVGTAGGSPAPPGTLVGPLDHDRRHRRVILEAQDRVA